MLRGKLNPPWSRSLPCSRHSVRVDVAPDHSSTTARRQFAASSHSLETIVRRASSGTCINQSPQELSGRMVVAPYGASAFRGAAAARQCPRMPPQHCSATFAYAFSNCCPPLRHHVRHSVDVDRLVFVLNPAADIAHFQRHSTMQLPLNCDVEGVHDVGPEVRIQRLARTGRDAVDTRDKAAAAGSGNLAVGDGRKRSCDDRQPQPGMRYRGQPRCYRRR